MRLCLSCFLRMLSIWTVALLLLVALLFLSASHTFTFWAGRWYEQGGPSRAWQTLANDLVNRDIARQLGEKGRK